MYNLIPFIVILLSLSAIIFIISRKFKKLRLVKIEHHQALVQSKTKLVILEQRLARGFAGFFTTLGKILTASIFKKIGRFKSSLQKHYQKLLTIKRHYKNNSLEEKKQTNEENISPSPETLKKIEELSLEAEEFTKKEFFKEAEEKYIEIISLAPKSIEAYRGLASVYKQNQNYVHAETTMEHILKLAVAIGSREAEDFISLGLIKQELGKNGEAMHYLGKALEIEPQNPRYLDLYLESCILCKEKDAAWQVYRRLKKVNPENQKLEEFMEKIRNI